MSLLSDILGRFLNAMTRSACMEFNATRFLWWINTAICAAILFLSDKHTKGHPVIGALVVVTTWLLLRSARGFQRVWSTPITQFRMYETKDITTPGNQHRSFYITTSTRLSSHLGQPQLLDQRGSSAALLYPDGSSWATPQPGESGEFTRTKTVGIGAGYGRANDPSAVLKQSEPVYTAVPTADPNLPEDRPYGTYGIVVVGSLQLNGCQDQQCGNTLLTLLHFLTKTPPQASLPLLAHGRIPTSSLLFHPLSHSPGLPLMDHRRRTGHLSKLSLRAEAMLLLPCSTTKGAISIRPMILFLHKKSLLVRREIRIVRPLPLHSAYLHIMLVKRMTTASAPSRPGTRV